MNIFEKLYNLTLENFQRGGQMVLCWSTGCHLKTKICMLIVCCSYSIKKQCVK